MRKCEEKLAKEAGNSIPDAEKENKKEKKDDDWMMTLTVIISLAFSIVLFMMLPFFISRGLKMIISSEILKLIAEGIVKMLIFFGYLALMS